MTATILRRGDAGYEEARLDAIWNGRKPDRQPEAIVLAKDVDDVVAAVRLARDRGWLIGVRSGGHSWSGNAIREGGLLLEACQHRVEPTMIWMRGAMPYSPGKTRRSSSRCVVSTPAGVCSSSRRP